MKKIIARYIILLTSLCLLSYGLYREEYKMVFKKAINICLECIGIG